MTSRLLRADAVNQLASTIVGGIYTAIAQNYANTIAQAFYYQIITPDFYGHCIWRADQPGDQPAGDCQRGLHRAGQRRVNDDLQQRGLQNAIRQIGTAIQGVTIAAVSTSGSVRGLVHRPAWRPVSKPRSQPIKQEWKSIADSPVDEIKRIRGELAEEGGRGYSYYAAQFATTTARARAGDRKAAASLPELSRSAGGSSLPSPRWPNCSALRPAPPKACRTRQGHQPSIQDQLAQLRRTDYVRRDMLAMIHKGERITLRRSTRPVRQRAG